MRSRYLISAAVLVAAACMGRRHEARPARPRPADAPPAAEPVAILPEPGPEAAAEAPTEAAEPAPQPAAIEGPVAEEAVAEETAGASDLPERVVAERGRFTLGGNALAPGHPAVAGVSFAARREVDADAGLLRVRLETALNVPAGGLLVLDDPGFAPDAEGFTVMLAAASAGRFAATGTYEVLAPHPSRSRTTASTGGTD